MDAGSLQKEPVRRGERGQIIPLLAIAMVVLLGAATLAVDVGYWRYQQRLAQSAADSAAIAGAGELAYPAAADWSAAAMSDATRNGFTDDGGANVIVKVNNGPDSGAYAHNNSAVEVIIKKKQPSFFAGIFGLTQWISVRAVAMLNTNGVYCIYALGGNIDLRGGGRGGVTAPTCGMVTNVDLIVTGSANVDARSIGYVGNPPLGGVYPLGRPLKTVPVSDPCSTIAGCAYLQNLTLNNPGALHTGCQPFPAPNPLPPGEYCVPLAGSNLTLQPGLFVLDQGMTSISVTGNNVTIYNLGTAGPFNGNNNVVITAPTTGNYAGMVYYQPASNNAAFNAFTKNGASGVVNFNGGFYAPTSDFTFNGNLPDVTLLVANSVRMNGGGINVPAVGGLQRSGHAVLAE